MDFYQVFNPLINSTIKLLLYTGYLDIDDHFYAYRVTKFDDDRVFATKCGNTSGAVAYLLNFTNTIETTFFRSNKAYQVTFQGVDNNDKYTTLGHEFVLLNNDSKWILIDSYIGYRELTCKFVDIDKITTIIKSLEEKFDNDLWVQLTGCSENTDDKMLLTIYEYDYHIDIIEENFKLLVKKAKYRLNNEEVGLSDDILFVLDVNLDQEEANKYLISCENIVK